LDNTHTRPLGVFAPTCGTIQPPNRPAAQVIAEHCAVILAYGTDAEKLRVRKFMDRMRRIKRRAAIEEKRRKP